MPRRTSCSLDRLAELFPLAVARSAELVALGVPGESTQYRCRPGGPWQRLLPGIVLLQSGQPTARQLVRAALTYGGRDAVLTGFEGARLCGLRKAPDDGEVHVLVPAGRRAVSRRFVMVERSWRMPSPVRVSGTPVAPLPRAVLDGARRCRDLDVIRTLIAEAVQTGRTTTAELAAELAAGPIQGSALPRRALAEIGAGVRSAAEAWAKAVAQASLLPAPRWNVELRDGAGRRLAIVDAWWDDVGLAWEIDSFAYHLGPQDYERTLRRHAALTAAGIVVLHTLPTRLKRDRAGVLRELRASHRQAARRPRPRVHAVS